VTVLLLALMPAYGQTPKHGGILNAMQAEDLPAGFSIHETSTILGLWPSMPCYSNLVIFDPFKPRETAETILPELAEKWSWQDDYRNLVFFLRRNVRWHDGQPFTAKDVKYTFDMVREAKDAPAKLRLNPRKEWYANIDTIETPDPFTVIFRLRRPQPSLLMMVASGYSPIYPAHVPPAALRAKCIGTGPFRFKEYTPGQVIQLERNPDYFVKDRPYLDGIRYPIIGERGTRMAALQAKQLDVSLPTEITTVMVETLKKTTPALVVTETSHSGSDTVLLNHKRPPFDNIQVRRAINQALDRRAYVKGLRYGGAIASSAMPPGPTASGVSPVRRSPRSRCTVIQYGIAPTRRSSWPRPASGPASRCAWSSPRARGRFRPISRCSSRNSSGRSASKQRSSRWTRASGIRR
jgi:peptide/nickel transport system substrate-binding protein